MQCVPRQSLGPRWFYSASFQTCRHLLTSWPLWFAAAIFCGVGLRLVWPADMEYKREEAWTFERTQQVGQTEPFPWVGMMNSARVPQPGMSLWTYLLLGKLFDVHDPVELCRASQLLNVAAIILLAVFVVVAVPPGERTAWLWAVALVAVNPLAVLFHRKIWPPSATPIFTLLLLVTWWYRHGRRGATLWGLAGSLLGQVHPVGMIFAAAFAGWARLFDRRPIAWKHWFLGTAIGALPLLPWLWAMANAPAGHHKPVQRLWHVCEGKFWTRWATEPFGISLHYALEDDFGDFLSYPLIGGQRTYLVGLLHVILLGVAAAILLRGAWRLRRNRGNWFAAWIGRGSETAFTLAAAFWGFGLLFTLSAVPIHRHYMTITFPLMFLWVARLALGDATASLFSDASQKRVWLNGNTWLLTLWFTQLLITLSFLGYVHVNPREIRGDYGVPYRAQMLGLAPMAGPTLKDDVVP
jgi:hypothetical protein